MMHVNGMHVFVAVFAILLPYVLPDNNVMLNGMTYQPDFAEPLENITIPVGRDAIFRCLVKNLGGYRVGWVKADTKAIQAIHEHVITQNTRVSVSHNDHSTWNLHIRNVQEEDRGQYMCQINTDPMKSQVGSLNVVVPPDIVDNDQLSDLMVPEGGAVVLRCRARGHPAPHIMWRREDATDIVIRDGQRTKAFHIYEGETLKLPKVSRTDMGAYLCIATNGVPPTVSKRYVVNVHFHPLIQVPNQLLGAPLGTDVKLECYVEASPRSINYWVRDSGDMVIASEKYDVKTITKSVFEVHMLLIVRNLRQEDVGSYRCVAKNALGEEESSIRIYEIPGPTRKGTQHRYDEEDYNGSAEKETEEELATNIADRRDQLVSNWDPSKSNNHNRAHDTHISVENRSPTYPSDETQTTSVSIRNTLPPHLFIINLCEIYIVILLINIFELYQIYV